MSSLVDVFYVLDFDRCIGDTDKFQLVLEQAVATVTQISPESIRTARRNTDMSGGSFDTARFVIEELIRTRSDITWQEICDEIVTLTKDQDMLEPYAADFLRILRNRGEYFGILTYGGKEWQRLKLATSGMGDVPFVITSVRNKGLTLTSWLQGDGTFIIPKEMTKDRLVRAKSLIFIDDKAVSFSDIPRGVRGVLVVWPDRRQPGLSQEHEVPLSVTTVEGMRGAIELLFGPI